MPSDSPDKLFDDYERTDESPALFSESPYTYLNRAAEDRYVKIRALLEDWFAAYPNENKAEEDVPSSVELRWRSGEHQAALTSSLCRTGPTGSAISRWRAARSVGRCR